MDRDVMTDIPFPLGGDQGIVHLLIPPPGLLSPDDADRLKRMIDSLVLHGDESEEVPETAQKAMGNHLLGGLP